MTRSPDHPMSVSIGDFELTALSDGIYRLDGGAYLAWFQSRLVEEAAGR